MDGEDTHKQLQFNPQFLISEFLIVPIKNRSSEKSEFPEFTIKQP